MADSITVRQVTSRNANLRVFQEWPGGTYELMTRLDAKILRAQVTEAAGDRLLLDKSERTIERLRGQLARAKEGADAYTQAKRDARADRKRLGEIRLENEKMRVATKNLIKENMALVKRLEDVERELHAYLADQVPGGE